MPKLKIVVTSGGTSEKIDAVRTISNDSTGDLGSNIADKFSRHGHNVVYVAPMSAMMPQRKMEFRPISTVQSIIDVMRPLVPTVDVVIQCVAASDFTFDLEGVRKLSSVDPESFIEHLSKTIKTAPKVISFYREWNSKAILVGFKFEDGLSKEALIKKAKDSMRKNKLDIVLANDKKMMSTAKEHVGTLVMRDRNEDLMNKDDISDGIYTNVMRYVMAR